MRLPLLSQVSTLSPHLSYLYFMFPPLLLLQTDHRNIEDPLLLMLDRQLHGVHSSLVVCKWPITLTSCFFATLLGWDMAGDQGGWFEALWVPIVGVVMVIAIWVWDRFLLSPSLSDQDWCPHFSVQSLIPHKGNSESTIASSLEIIRSVLHGPPLATPDHESGLAEDGVLPEKGCSSDEFALPSSSSPTRDSSVGDE